MTEISEEQFFERCRYYAKKDEFPKIVEEAEKFLKCDSDNETALYELAYAFYVLQSFRRSKRILKKLVNINSNEAKYHLLYGGVLYELKKYTQGDNEFSKAFELDPDTSYTRAYYAGCLVQRNVKKYANKIKELCQKELQGDPNYATAYYYMALAYLEENNTYRAEENIKRAVMIAPKDEYARAYYGIILERKKDIDRAIEQYRLCLEINPNIRLNNAYTPPQLALKYALQYKRSPVLYLLHKAKDKLTLAMHKTRYLLIPFALIKILIEFCLVMLKIIFMFAKFCFIDIPRVIIEELFSKNKNNNNDEETNYREGKKMEGLKFYIDWDESEKGMTLVKKIEDYIKENSDYKYEKLIIGAWEEVWENSPEPIINYLVENKSKFPNLKSIHIGDMDSEECEISWIIHTDVSPLLRNFKLEELIITGAVGLRLTNASSDTLRKLEIISGGISKDTLQDIANAKFPKIQHLELYIGVDGYGFNGSISDIEYFMRRENFPNLKYLGLKNSEIQDEICEKVVKSNIIEGLDILDLSLGTLSDEGARAIVNNADRFKSLKELDLTYNYISDEWIDKLEEIFDDSTVEILVDRDDAESYIDDDEEWRFPYITE